MKKVMAVGVVLGAALVLAGCGNKQQATNVNVAQDQKQGEATSQDSGAKQSLLDKLLSKGGMKCTVEQDGDTTTILTNGTKAKIEGMGMPNPKDPNGAKEKGYMVNDGTWAYIWSGNTGMKFNLKDAEEISKNNSGTQDQSTKGSDWKNWAKEMETSGAKYDCSPAVVSDSDFTPPTNVTFQDMGELFKQMQNYKPQIPAGANVPQIPNIAQ